LKPFLDKSTFENYSVDKLAAQSCEFCAIREKLREEAAAAGQEM